MIDKIDRRRFFAEELEAVCRLRSPALVDAFATVPREQFLPPGPWTVWTATADSDVMSGIRLQTTPDANAAHVYHNISVAIDPSRQLFNGQPGTIGVWIDALDLGPGERVLHIGCGLGYYTAVMAHCVGPAGRVAAVEVDEALAAEARQNLASLSWVGVSHGDGSRALDETFDAVLVNAGVTHPLDAWLDALAAGGRMILPLTGTLPGMAPTIGKGLVMLLTKQATGDFSVRVLAVVAIYSAVGVRDAELGDRLGKAMMSGPMRWRAVNRLRRDSHDESPACWLHGEHFCFSTI
jgi:protein-L-isoaspartate(D-aspartate) O-methyltransferase